MKFLMLISWMMIACVFSASHQLKILNTIICRNAIDMVNNLRGFKRTTQMLCHHIAMFSCLFFTKLDGYITRLFNIVSFKSRMQTSNSITTYNTHFFLRSFSVFHTPSRMSVFFMMDCNFFRFFMLPFFSMMSTLHRGWLTFSRTVFSFSQFYLRGESPKFFTTYKTFIEHHIYCPFVNFDVSINGDYYQ